MASTETTSDNRRLAALMFTDMVGFSALTQRDEALALLLLEEHRSVVRSVVAKHAGQEIKTTGDGFLIEFASALTAVQCAVDIQKALTERNASQPPERQVRIRIGLHLGDIVERAGDVFGDGVNIAARIEPLAEPGGICISNAVYDQIANKVSTPLVPLPHAALKNIQTAVQIYKLVWDGSAVPAAPSTARLPVSSPAKPSRRFSGRVAAAIAALLGLSLVLPRFHVQSVKPPFASVRVVGIAAQRFQG